MMQIKNVQKNKSLKFCIYCVQKCKLYKSKSNYNIKQLFCLIDLIDHRFFVYLDSISNIFLILFIDNVKKILL